MGYFDAFLLLDDFFTSYGITRWIYIPVFWMLMLLLFVLTSQLPAFVISMQAKSRKVLVMGPANSGKTTMVLSMKRGSFVPTAKPSTRVNTSTFCPLTDRIYKSMTFVDVPPSQSARVLGTLDRSVKGIMFVVGANNWAAQTSDAAEQLYSLLSSPAVLKNKVPVLVTVNQTDVANSTSEKAIKTQLQDELSRLHASKAKNVKDTANEGAAAGLKVDAKGRFSFDAAPVPVKFASTSTKKRDWELMEDFVMDCAFRK